jgi:hypothetical protein
MATDVLQFLVDIFKINQNLVSEYASQGPLYQLFYLFIFPAIFILIFIWILTNRIMGEHKGLRILLSVGVYAFIILQGYYSWFVMLSKFWFFGLIGLGFLYFISYRGGGGRGRGAQGMTSEGGKGGRILSYLQDSTGKMMNPAEASRLKNMLERDLGILKGNRKVLEQRAKTIKEQKAAEQIYDEIAHVDRAISTLEGFRASGAYADYKKYKSMEGNVAKAAA